MPQSCQTACCEGNVRETLPKSCPRARIHTHKPLGSCLSILGVYLHSTVAALRGNVCQKSQFIKKLFLKQKHGSKKSDFTNSCDSNKNKLCQFCRMCSFLFTASGGKRCSDALRHGKKPSSRRVLAEPRPLSFGHSCLILIVLYKFIVPGTKFDLQTADAKPPRWRLCLVDSPLGA